MSPARWRRAVTHLRQVFVESFGGRLRDELLAVEAFSSLLEAKTLVEDWRIDDNRIRPTVHTAIARPPTSPGP